MKNSAVLRPNHARRRRGARRNAGFVMLEALVAGLIFAVGVLGVVGLQASMTQSQTTSQFRGEATHLAGELIGLLWADLPGLTNYNTAQCAAYARCNDWANKVARTLPGATTAVAVNAGTGVVTISISWTTRSGVQTYSTNTSVVA
jgi:type IV pilus assembly protein PilV